MDHQELEWQSTDWINVTQDVVNVVMNLLVLATCRKVLDYLMNC
jgi:hypothetical protein